MSEKVPDGADSFGPLGGFRRLVEEEISVKGMHELRSDAVVAERALEERSAERRNLG